MWKLLKINKNTRQFGRNCKKINKILFFYDIIKLYLYLDLISLIDFISIAEKETKLKIARTIGDMTAIFGPTNDISIIKSVIPKNADGRE